MSKRILTPEETEQFISLLQSGETVVESVTEVAQKDMGFEYTKVYFQQIEDDGAPYFE